MGGRSGRERGTRTLYIYYWYGECERDMIVGERSNWLRFNSFVIILLLYYHRDDDGARGETLICLILEEF